MSSDDKVLPTTYGELRPPLGKHRLKVGAEFVLYKFIYLSYVVGCLLEDSLLVIFLSILVFRGFFLELDILLVCCVCVCVPSFCYFYFLIPE